MPKTKKVKLTDHQIEFVHYMLDLHIDTCKEMFSDPDSDYDEQSKEGSREEVYALQKALGSPTYW